VPLSTRAGLGFDVHPFSTDASRPLILGGTKVDGPGLAGHSDADVLAHAVADALLGAAAMGDLGSRYPDDDPAWAGADSMGLLAEVVRLVCVAFDVLNVDTTVVAEIPPLAPYRQAMEARLGAVLGAPVSVKVKRAESLGALGRGEGVAALAVALLQQR
jgi:2-C-methyl-D-erythritol 2,4-cyclodiphosphate synthase